MKIVFKIILSLFLILVLGLGLAVVTANFWVGPAVAAIIHNATGFPVKIDKVNINLSGTAFGVYGIKIMNPPGFNGMLASIPEIYVDLNIAPFFEQQMIHLETVHLDIAEFSIVRNEQGVSNLDHLKTLKKDKAEAVKPKAPEKPAAKPKFLIDELVLTIRTVKYEDRSLPVAINRSIDLKVDKEIIKGLTSPADIVRLVLMKILYSSSIGNLGLPVDLMKQQFGPTLQKGQQALTEGTELARQMSTEALGTGKKFVEEAVGKIPTEVPVSAEVEKITKDVTGTASGLLKGAGKFLKSTTNTIAETVESKSDSSKTQS